MARTVITGGAGFVGSHLAEALAQRGHEVTVLDNLSNGKPQNLAALDGKLELVYGDVCDITQLRNVFKGKDYVFHLAAVASVPFCQEHPETAEKVNVIGTNNVLEAARNTDVTRVIHASTAAVYGDNTVVPLSEYARCSPIGAYAHTKLAAERLVEEYSKQGLETVTLRCFNIYGPRQDPKSPYSGVITKFVSVLANRRAPTIYGNGEQTRDFVNVEDVVQANLLAMEAPHARNRVFNIGSGTQTSINGLFSTLCAIFKNSITPRYEPAREGDILHSGADITLARAILGYEPHISLREGLEKTVAHTTL